VLSAGFSKSVVGPEVMRVAEDCCVLVVDDDVSIRAVVREALEGEGYRVLTAANGAQALEEVERSRPDIVLLDMRMPIMDGWEFSRRVKEKGSQPVIVTMTAARNAKSWAAEIGADAYVAKPFDLDDLFDVVASCCANAHSRPRAKRSRAP
jgi:CheY-like chemotaxis protein